MKPTIQLLTCAAMLFITSCDKGYNDGGKSAEERLIGQISAKWDISSNATYVSVELDKNGNYVIVKNLPQRATSNDFKAIFGVYKVLNATTIELVNFGKIGIISLSSSALSLNLTINNLTTPIALSAVKVDNSANIPASTKTELLCRRWELTKIDGVDISQLPESEQASMPSNVYFSAAGTYILSHKDGSAELSNWKWFDASENKLFYSWSFPPVWQENNENTGTALITTLTSSKLVVTEMSDDGASSATELKPATTAKSSATATSSTAKSTQRKGLFGNK